MDFAIARRRMVEQQIMARGVTDQRVLDAMLQVPRHLFVEPGLHSHAYSDASLPIGEKQTISQPYMVASMSAALELEGHERILEIGTGSGYQSAILSLLVKRVYSIERISSLAGRARKVLDQLCLSNVNIKVGDGTIGWKDQAPFDGILVAAGAPDIPTEYLQQLEIGGKLVLPVGDRSQQILMRITRLENGNYKREQLMGCRFVPLIGEQGWLTADED
ncbi:protein-L-isoaspartate(D-aspartate) O-methyltransferase [Malonomonas rubra DSM 5091]|uniref:Protein-L-isoaspartate O-methyltransferase n=1 Tax=Malonomonas rubra DSM 5091 TaxID=1122189 RepID=A0A1M6DBR7_MALRU|nr:protein-L-isoaspartate(D-aspartate) O-methyltransferase [Malonomonas rubra]SHI70704.1 protein-L-isoaspartate(D-aspartate) O-methyltransferase [Malonomonas rubra DSM 5091]